MINTTTSETTNSIVAESEFGGILGMALANRETRLHPAFDSALRVFNGFYEGYPDLSVDIYGRTLVIHNYASEPANAGHAVAKARDFYEERLPWLKATVVKSRYSKLEEEKRGLLVKGDSAERVIRENGVAYAIDIMLNQDTSFYLDTRHLREWLTENMTGKTVLNTFAYTGSLGIAALAGGARRVIQTDISRAFLNVARDSTLRNGFLLEKANFVNGDFWAKTASLKRENVLLDCVIVDPPLYSKTRGGTVDLAASYGGILNKIRPLIADNGYLITINNALFISGKAHMEFLNQQCEGGYLTVESIVPVPEDFIGATSLDSLALPADPTPFNHSTKIVILKVKRKDGRVS